MAFSRAKTETYRLISCESRRFFLRLLVNRHDNINSWKSRLLKNLHFAPLQRFPTDSIKPPGRQTQSKAPRLGPRPNGRHTDMWPPLELWCGGMANMEWSPLRMHILRRNSQIGIVADFVVPGHFG